MQKKPGFLVIALLLLAAVSAPQKSWASNIPTGADAPVATNDCPSGNATDEAYFTNKSADMQRTAQNMFNINTLYPIATSANSCIGNLLNAFNKLPAIMSSPNPLLAAITAVAGQIVSQVINSTCQSALGTVTSAQNALTNLTKICLPIPKFNGLDLPTISAPSCSGGITVSPVSFSANSSFVQTSVNPYLK